MSVVKTTVEIKGKPINKHCFKPMLWVVTSDPQPMEITESTSTELNLEENILKWEFPVSELE